MSFLNCILYRSFLKSINATICVAICTLTAACAQKPTKLFETQTAETKLGDAISADTFVIDARPAFDYSVSHINGSLNMRWEDFAQREEPFKGLLEKDIYFHARRLARYGIQPETPVVVVGRGLQGEGEEGRLAWTLKYLGLKNVSFSSIDSFSLPLTHAEAAPRESVPIWKPAVDSSLIVEKKQFLNQAMSGRLHSTGTVIIDVRPEIEYLGKGMSAYSRKAPDLGAINIPWTQFLTSQGKANTAIQVRLAAVEITTDKTILVIDDKGVRSAAVTLVLRELGYGKAANFAGGYMELLANKP